MNRKIEEERKETEELEKRRKQTEESIQRLEKEVASLEAIVNNENKIGGWYAYSG